MLLHDLERALMQHARAAVVAEAAPGGEHDILGGGGQCFDSWETIDEDSVVVEYGRNAGLLQHDFAEPDAVRVARFAPGEITAMTVIPAEQAAAEMVKILARQKGVNLSRA